MAKLFTHHDHNNAHKSLGLVVLLQFVYRFVNLALCGSCFPDSEPLWASTLLLLAHACLSVSSLIFRLPAKRNFTSPMVWPEFRMHSIVFATRHVCVTLLSLFCVWPWVSPGEAHIVLQALACLARGVVVAGFSVIAGQVTQRLGDSERRTTNAMPYPASMTGDQRSMFKKFYAQCQFGAIAMCAFPSPSLAYMPLLAIQIAPFMMTLVRKGLASSAAYHGVYSVSLWLAVLLAPSAAQFRVPIIFSIWLCRICMHHARTVHSCAAKWVQLCGVSLLSLLAETVAPTFLVNGWWDRALLLANCAYVLFRISQFCRCIS